jgi:hypothetical protein
MGNVQAGGCLPRDINDDGQRVRLVKVPFNSNGIWCAEASADRKSELTSAGRAVLTNATPAPTVTTLEEARRAWRGTYSADTHAIAFPRATKPIRAHEPTLASLSLELSSMSLEDQASVQDRADFQGSLVMY